MRYLLLARTQLGKQEAMYSTKRARSILIIKVTTDKTIIGHIFPIFLKLAKESLIVTLSSKFRLHKANC